MQQLHFKGAIFDLDGTLLDSMGVWRKVDEDFLGKRGFAVPEDYLKKITSMEFQTAAEYTIERFLLNEKPEDVIAEWQEMVVDAYTYHVKLKPHVKEYLDCLKEQGISIALATAASPDLYVPALRNNGVLDHFRAFVSVRDVARGKGFPDVYEKAAEKLQLKPQDCVVFEDILKGIQGAKMGGFQTVAVYDAASWYEQEELQRTADCYITDFSQL